ncbi:endonuclease/exonuclease/phosphatase family protein [Paraferrimonas sedimenticola]|uniref:Endonuclease n=1 Tax=Paraferrimonas sedimenticola TaxID=375674 RepID=A0AA37RYQ4_9GAMM|nr:endonuclease/exonuclease/phosphatase family protein [Paraferrimonas sedimenticola]GLP97920.1 endonuclease [Paraferrimonas sedimenticola]
MRIVTQNLWHGGRSRVEALLEYLYDLHPDVLVLTEFRADTRAGDSITTSLNQRNYYTAHSDDSKTNGVLIASKAPISLVESGFQKVIVDLDGYYLRVFGVYLPNQPSKEKDDYWRDVINFASNNLHRRTLLVGDFNSCLPVDCESKSKFYDHEVRRLLETGFIDLWQEHQGRGSRHTWWYRGTTGFRLDYVYASPAIKGTVSIEHLDCTRGEQKLSDHSTLLADLETKPKV